MNKRLAFFLLMIIIALSGCAAAKSANRGSTASGVAEAPAMPELQKGDLYSGAARDMGAPQEVAPAAAPLANAAAERIVLRSANLTIVVDDPAKALSAVAKMAESMGGYIVSSNVYKTSGENGREFPEGNITVRVPAEKLTEAMDKIKALVKDPKNDVRAETVSGQDVTKDYTDLKSRLRNLEDAERQLREIMASATKTEDVMSVYNQLIQIREQIEMIKGQIQYYDEAAALSSISVIIKAQAAVQPLEVGGWQPVGVARDAVQALIDTGQVLGSVVIWLVIYALPIGLIIYLPLRGLWLLVRRLRKNGKKAASVPPPSAD